MIRQRGKGLVSHFLVFQQLRIDGDRPPFDLLFNRIVECGGILAKQSARHNGGAGCNDDKDEEPRVDHNGLSLEAGGGKRGSAVEIVGTEAPRKLSEAIRVQRV